MAISIQSRGNGKSAPHPCLPASLSNAVYNANNQQTQFGAASLTYDANGDLTSDGKNTYTWNARNQLVSIGGSVAANFQYDAFGRRVSKTIGGTTQYLYDGANPVEELSGETVTASLLAGGIDEYFQRTDISGPRSFLTDALGSTVALADPAGAAATQYTYEPFGNTTSSGAATTNSFAFTGRELDATGLYFYRARYYSSLMGRFIAEDPLGFAGGQTNLYGYAFANPMAFTDPLGLYSGMEFMRDFGTFSEAFADTLTFGSASRLNNALGANIAVERCSWVHTAGSIAGIAASIPIGGEALPAALRWLPSGAKGVIGEGLSIAKNTLKGSRLIGSQLKATELEMEGLTTAFDSVWESASGERYFVESKFGTSSLTKAQRIASQVLADAYHVERWTYPFFGDVGRLLGPIAGTAGAMSGRKEGCN